MKDKPDALRRESFRCTADEKASAQKEAKRRGMTFSQLVRLAVVQLVSRNAKRAADCAETTKEEG